MVFAKTTGNILKTQVSRHIELVIVTSFKSLISRLKLHDMFIVYMQMYA